MDLLAIKKGADNRIFTLRVIGSASMRPAL